MRNRLLTAGVMSLLVVVCSEVVMAQKIDDYFLNSTAVITWHPNASEISIGSGFFILYQVSRDVAADRSTYKVLLITNRHVLPPDHSRAEISVRIVVRQNNGGLEVKDVSVPIFGGDGVRLPSVAFHPDHDVDVAAIDVGKVLMEQRANFIMQAVESHVAVTKELLIRPEDLKEAAIGIGTQVYLLGYPAGIFDTRNTSPILRIGVISSEPDHDFAFNERLRNAYGLPRKVRGFLIDANVFPGSSGSIVIRRTNMVPGFSSGGKPAIPYILGIVAMSVPIDDFGQRQRMGLGVVFGADTIRETINTLLTQEGIDPH